MVSYFEGRTQTRLQVSETKEPVPKRKEVQRKCIESVRSNE